MTPLLIIIGAGLLIFGLIRWIENSYIRDIYNRGVPLTPEDYSRLTTRQINKLKDIADNEIKEIFLEDQRAQVRRKNFKIIHGGRP